MRLNIPYLDSEELDEIAKVLATGFLTQGPRVAEFEEGISKLIGAKYAFAMSSCTTALHLALVALGIGRDDDVLVPDFTFPATANAVVQQGARPILVDVCNDNYCMDVVDLEKKITPKTRAIIPVHAFGLSADMDAIMDVAKRHNLAVIEDAACALGALYHDRYCGTIGELGCFSFHPRKSITTGEGGMIVTNDDELAQRIRLLRSHGGVRGELYFQFEDAGFNYRMSDVQAAMGVAQLRKFDWILNRKRELAAQLSMMLSNVKDIEIPVEPQGTHHTYQSYVILLDERFDRNSVIKAMRTREIETTLGTYALHEQPFFQRKYGYRSGDFPTSSRIFRSSLTLPLYPQMTTADLESIVVALAESLDEASK